MSVLRLNPTSDLSDDAGRAQLQETLELISAALRRQDEDIANVLAADKAVRPVPISAFPMALGQVSVGAGNGSLVGDIIWRAKASAPAGFLECNGDPVSRTTYATLFAEIGTDFGVGDGLTTFNLPDLKGRSPMGKGTGSGLTARTLGVKYGSEDLKTHGHGSSGSDSGHVHPIGGHAHDMRSHKHTDTYYLPAAGSTTGPACTNAGTTPSNFTDDGADYNTTTGPTDPGGGTDTASGTANVSVSVTNYTGATDNLHPVTVLAAYICYSTGVGGSSQYASLAWGDVQGIWNLASATELPGVTVVPAAVSVPNTAIWTPVLQLAANPPSGSASTISTDYIRAVIKVPYNFRKWGAKALMVRTRVTTYGGSNWYVTLKVVNPVGGGYLAATKSRLVTGNEADFSDLTFSSEDMGSDWKPGYPLMFDLFFYHDTDYSGLGVEVGLLEIGWR